ncbi:hypothetical protein QE418_000143 [Microbacterium testaceum]|nr:hypothetical protein [Microbacterium testaceum]
MSSIEEPAAPLADLTDDLARSPFVWPMPPMR